MASYKWRTWSDRKCMDANKMECEKIKAQTSANKKYISNMLNEIADHYQEN